MKEALAKLPAEDLEVLFQQIADLKEDFDRLLGTDFDVVVLVHKSHEAGQGCEGVSCLTSVHNPAVIAGILSQALDGVTGTMARIPPGASLN